MRTLRFATSWNLTEFLLSSEAEFCVGPFGPNEATVRLRPIDFRHEIYVECIHEVTRKQMMLLDHYHDMIVATDESLISTLKLGEPKSGLNPETTSLYDDIELLRPLVNGVSDATYVATDQLLKTLRWRLGKGFNYKLATRTSIYWQSFNDKGWRRVPTRPPQTGPVGLIVGVSLPSTILTEIQRRLTSKEVSPLCFDILIKSSELIRTQPSLSLFGAVQAIEIGVKECIVRLCPQASWLAFEAPTAPVAEILSDYLPTLISNEETRRVFASFVELKLKDIRKVVHIRNRITHKGILADSEQAQFASDLASQVLYQLDFASGEQWAANFGYV